MPGGKISEIYGEIRIQITKMQQDLALAQKKLDNFQKQVSPIFAKLAQSIAITGAAITAVMTKSVLDTVRYSEETLKLAKALGMTTDEVQELAYATKQADTDIEALQRGTTQLLMQMSRARDGSEEAAKSFVRLGISYKNQDGTLRSTKDVLMDIADKMKGGKLTTDQLAIATDLFGAKTAKELIPTLMKGSEWFKEMADEAHRFGIVMSEEDIQAAEEFGDKIELLKDIVNGLKRAFAKELIPVLDSLIKVFLNPENIEMYSTTMVDFGKMIAGALQKLPTIIGTVVVSFESMHGILLKLRKDFALLMAFETGWFTPIARDFRKNAEEWNEELIKSSQKQDQLMDFFAGMQSKVDIAVASFGNLKKGINDVDDAIGNITNKGGKESFLEFHPEPIISGMGEISVETGVLADAVDKIRAGLENMDDTAIETAESMGELFGTAIQSGGDWLVMLKKIIGQQIRYNVLSKMGWQGQFFSGLMQVFGFQEGGFIPKQMPIINVAAINENPRRPEVAIDMSGRGTTAIPLDQIGKFVEVKNYVNVAGADVFIRSLAGAKKDAFDELAIPISEALTRRDNR